MLHRFIHWSCLCFALIVSTVGLLRAEAADEPDVEPATETGLLFETDVRPLLERRCFECHGEAQQKAELKLANRGNLLAGGESGAAIEPGEKDKSLLFEHVSTHEMPPRHWHWE